MIHHQVPLAMPCYDLLLITDLTVAPVNTGSSGTVSFSELTGGFRFHLSALCESESFPSSHWTSGFPASSEVNASDPSKLEFFVGQFLLALINPFVAHTYYRLRTITMELADFRWFSIHRISRGHINYGSQHPFGAYIQPSL